MFTYMNWQLVCKRLSGILQQSIRTNHNRILTAGILVLFIYLVLWVGILCDLTLKGSSTTLLNIGFVYLGLDMLWRKRSQFLGMQSPDEDRMIGYLLILGSVFLYILFFSKVSIQALLCIMILAGIALSHWGIPFFRERLLPITLVLTGIYPDLSFLANTVRRMVADHQVEFFTAWMTGLTLRIMGHPVTVQGDILSLSSEINLDKAVQIASGCSGFDMAFTLAGVGLIFGLFFKQSALKTWLLMSIGVMLALAFNIPRVILLAFSVSYWGKDAFNFWHGPIGGQMFSCTLLTVYYYIVMGIVNKPSEKARMG
jgi:exosortase